VKLGLISDVHGDPVALELAWAHLTVLGAEAIVCAGDLVGYGPRPDEAVAFVTERRIPSVRGNHDRWALRRGPGVFDPFGGGAPSATTLEFLRGLPEHVELPFGRRVGVVVHGAPGDDMEFITRKAHPPKALRKLLSRLGADLLIHGHTHAPMWHRCDLGLVVNPGSVISAPVVKTSRTFALVETDTLDVTFHDVESGALVEVEPWEKGPGAGGQGSGKAED
jgi:putative phosphoesterase